MGVDISTYRCCIGTFRHGSGLDVVLLRVFVNYNKCLKMVGVVTFVGLLLLMAGIEANPGPLNKPTATGGATQIGYCDRRKPADQLFKRQWFVLFLDAPDDIFHKSCQCMKCSIITSSWLTCGFQKDKQERKRQNVIWRFKHPNMHCILCDIAEDKFKVLPGQSLIYNDLIVLSKQNLKHIFVTFNCFMSSCKGYNAFFVFIDLFSNQANTMIIALKLISFNSSDDHNDLSYITIIFTLTKYVNSSAKMVFPTSIDSNHDLRFSELHANITNSKSLSIKSNRKECAPVLSLEECSRVPELTPYLKMDRYKRATVKSIKCVCCKTYDPMNNTATKHFARSIISVYQHYTECRNRSTCPYRSWQSCLYTINTVHIDAQQNTHTHACALVWSDFSIKNALFRCMYVLNTDVAIGGCLHHLACMVVEEQKKSLWKGGQDLMTEKHEQYTESYLMKTIRSCSCKCAGANQVSLYRSLSHISGHIKTDDYISFHEKCVHQTMMENCQPKIEESSNLMEHEQVLDYLQFVFTIRLNDERVLVKHVQTGAVSHQKYSSRNTSTVHNDFIQVPQTLEHALTNINTSSHLQYPLELATGKPTLSHHQLKSTGIKQINNRFEGKAYKHDDDILDLKSLFEIRNRSKNATMKLYTPYLQRCTKDKNELSDIAVNDYTTEIRKLTWLPLDQLPVPQIDITVALVFEPLDYIFKQMAGDETPGPEITMRYELLRLCTLRNYPKENKPYIIRLAGAGFYFAAQSDEVVCYCCGLRRSSWTESDVPYTIHQRLSPRCSFLTINSEVNVPVPKADRPGPNRFAFIEERTENYNSTATSVSAQASAANLSGNSGNNDNFATIGAGTHQRSGNFVGRNSEARITPTTSQHSTTSSAVNTEQPKYPSYAVKSVRLASFQGWPDNIGQSADVMADAGFYFAGIGDAVRCFFCGIAMNVEDIIKSGLRHWTPEDNPWIEHARWSRQCVYVKMIKGEEYINLVHLAMQLTQDDEEQAGAIGGASASHIPIEEINNILLTSAAQSVLEMGYTPTIIKQAIEIILRETGRSGISSTNIMAKVLELEDKATALALANELGQLAINTQGITATNSQHVARQTTSTTQNEAGQSTSTTLRSQCEARPTVESPRTNQQSKGTTSQANQGQIKKSTNNPAAQVTRNPVSNIERDPLSNKDKKHSSTLQKDAKSIKAENDRMLEQTMCKVCMDKAVCIVFLPCGHLVTCAECAPAMRKCPICRILVKGTVKTFMS